MKEFSKKISAILMALVVVLSTMSFTVSQHYCGGELMDSALFSKAESCGMDMTISTKNDCNIQSKNCCKDVIKQIEGKKVVNIDGELFSFQQQLFVASFIYTYINLFEGLDTNIIPFKNYSPPLLVSDIQVTHQVFII
jgi:hypothetical protein